MKYGIHALILGGMKNHYYQLIIVHLKQLLVTFTNLD